ncbi:two-component system response regulator [Malaciobacter marinus]|uniref:Two-component system response regulator n=2 Tax=Malaciobacter marinus TaxID=505249 RepID=A0A347TH04_9BACT|nr:MULTISPECIES: response regulator transcription factor [Malaciobacter]AXX85882.1 two-component system response regulator [Malaciobacter marinus]PHO12808.1 hypothetical protein CPG38_05955 [Malaciobacter marinus]PHO14994.1 hypothetical protein CPH92_09070 [Malaciobacter marinus]RYA24318.1 DNA-binding response regulator [Malaciobacter halophilus]
MIRKLENILKSTKVLLVEDEEDLRFIIQRSIYKYVNSIVEAKNGAEGLEKFLSHDIDLILSDINMQKMSGLKMLKKIREYNSTIPVIFLTAYDTDENILDAINLTNSFLLKKPFEKKQLLTTIQMVMGQQNINEEIIELGEGFSYSVKNKELFYKEELISLTKLEKKLLEVLVHNKTHVVTYEMIENFVWQEKGATQEVIRAYIKKLRKKTYQELIENIQGIGYLLKI